MTRRRATLYGLFAVFALLVSTVVAWSCALWSPIPTSRSLSREEAATVLAEWLGTGVRFTASPSGLEQSGVGVALIHAGDARVPQPTLEQLNRPGRPGLNSFSLMPSGPDDKWAQVVCAGWPLRCLEGATTASGRRRERAGVLQPPQVMDEMGVKPRRRLPLYPRWPGLAANTIFYAAVLWLAIPGPKAIRRFVRRRRARCPECGYDVGHHDHETCPECGAA